MSTEEWRDVPDSYLQISNLGNVRSATRKGLHRDMGRELGAWKVLKPYPNTFGYLMVNWYSASGRRTATVHKLVLEAFHGPKPPGYEARHLNGAFQDNRADNLAWGSREDNLLDQVRHGTFIGKFTGDDVKAIRAAYADGATSYRKLAVAWGVSPAAIRCIVKGITYKRVWRESRKG